MSKQKKERCFSISHLSFHPIALNIPNGLLSIARYFYRFFELPIFKSMQHEIANKLNQLSRLAFQSPFQLLEDGKTYSLTTHH